MAAVGGNNITWFTYTGADGEEIPDDATHVFVDAKIIPECAFDRHHNIVEVICRDRVEKIEEFAFVNCFSLRRLIMRGVKVAERGAFKRCGALTDVECGKLKIIGEEAFIYCASLRSINLPSARIVEMLAFHQCKALADVKFGNKLERIGQSAFWDCPTLERITIPLKDGMITADGIFIQCGRLKRVDLVDGAELHETIAALHFEEWRNDMWEEINSIHQILPNADAGRCDHPTGFFDGEKAQVIRRWLRSVLDKMICYKEEHQGILDEARTALVLALPRDIVMNNVLPFLELPPHRFGMEDREDDIL